VTRGVAGSVEAEVWGSGEDPAGGGAVGAAAVAVAGTAGSGPDGAGGETADAFWSRRPRSIHVAEAIAKTATNRTSIRATPARLPRCPRVAPVVVARTVDPSASSAWGCDDRGAGGTDEFLWGSARLDTPPGIESRSMRASDSFPSGEAKGSRLRASSSTL
jgi:hypothetical protein